MEEKTYIGVTLQIERLHRRFLDIIKFELDRLGIEDINNIQTLIIYNIGNRELTIGELTSRGYYLGSNVSYSVKNLVKNGYLIQTRSEHDKRSVRVRLSEKSMELCRHIDEMYKRQEKLLSDAGCGKEKLEEVASALKTIEKFWASQLHNF